MPEAYRKTLIRQISQHAHSEIVGQLPEGTGSRARLRSSASPSCWPRSGRSRPRPVPVQRRRNAGRVARRTAGGPAQRQSQVFEHLQLPDAVVGRHGRHRLAGRWLGHHQPDSAVPLLLRPVCARHDPRLQGRILPRPPGLRHHAGAVPRHARAESHGAGCAEPLVVAVA
jgi:hypothetical protein